MTANLTLTITPDTVGGGMPLRVAAFLMLAISTAYPSATALDSTGGQLRLAIPPEDYRSEVGIERQKRLQATLQAFDPQP